MADTAPDGPAESAGADQLTVRRANLALVLNLLRSAGPWSRAGIATETGLNRATVSSLIAELVERGVVREGELTRGRVGRPAQVVELDGRACGVGLEANVDYVAVHVLDLRGEDVVADRVAADVGSLGPDATLDLMADLAAGALATAADQGRTVVGITAAMPGMVETEAGIVALAPNLGWRNVAVTDGLRRRLAGVRSDTHDLPLLVDNEANLAALAEYAMGAAAEVPHFVQITGEVGLGAGVVVDGQVLRGADGFAGEVGHMPIGDPDRVCGCGRRGCWETVAGLAAMLRAVADEGDPVADPSLDIAFRLDQIRLRAESGDQRTLRGLAELGAALGRGASVLADIFNPRMIVFGGYVAALADQLVPAIEEYLDQRVVVSGLGRCSVTVSALGFTASARGGAHVALQTVFADPTSFPPDGTGSTPAAPESTSSTATDSTAPDSTAAMSTGGL